VIRKPRPITAYDAALPSVSPAWQRDAWLGRPPSLIVLAAECT
jgi:hypothetical protein